MALRTAEVLGLHVGAVDIVRTAQDGSQVFDVSTDSCHTIIDRHFKTLPEYREFFNIDQYIANTLLADDAE